MKFRATIVAGHKGAAFEVPFDPSAQWHVAAQSVGPSRNGWFARARVGRMAFDTVVVPRSRRFWALIDEPTLTRLGVRPGDEVSVSIEARVVAAAKKNATIVSPAKAAQLIERARAMCLALDGAEEKLAHGEPTFRVRNRVFVMVANDHHGDGRIALWLNAPLGEQAACVERDPENFFVPPYVGVKGWIGMRLDRGLSPAKQRESIRLAYDETVARTAMASRGL